MTPDRISKAFWAAGITVVLACMPTRGGWDVDRLLAAEPTIVALEGQRLGDMLPFPALDGDRIVFVACRFAPERRVRVRGGGSQWPANWGQAAVRAIDRSVRRVELVLENDSDPVAENRSQIRIVTIQSVEGEGPSGLGDTLSECDVSPVQGMSGVYRGVLTRAEIRMRRAQLDMTERVRDALAEEWVGALMHELAHALGFAGHAAAGDSILVRDESRIRAAGRRALIGEAMPEPTLEALYRLRPGQRLGARRVKKGDLSWLDGIRKLDREWSASGRTSIGTFASVGDHQARIIWRYSDGSELGVRLPHWSSELREGVAITLKPERATRRLIANASNPSKAALALD